MHFSEYNNSNLIQGKRTKIILVAPDSYRERQSYFCFLFDAFALNLINQ
jgi:hypothetical protein